MTECAICLESLEDGNKCMLPGCNHGFHVSCILNNIQYDKRCPICRENIPNVEEKKPEETNNIISLETFYNDYQRKRRNFLNKRRRIIKNDEQLYKLDKKLKEETKLFKQTEKDIDKLWNVKTRKLWSSDDEMLQLRSISDKQARKCSRIEKKIMERLQEFMGPIPNFDDGFDHILQFIN
tara:strand:- start:1065 stop:1604 length:540 start_codon:yes stop_codon:yes gene_type:complete